MNQMSWTQRGSRYLVASFAISLSSLGVVSADTGSTDGDASGEVELENGMIRHEPWLYVAIPRYGITTLQEALNEESPAYEALLLVGEPIENYEPVAVHAPTPSDNNGALTLLMLPERCLGDFNNDAVVDLYDMPLFLDAYTVSDPAADLTRDGLIDLRDQVYFLMLATLPCQSAW